MNPFHLVCVRTDGSLAHNLTNDVHQAISGSGWTSDEPEIPLSYVTARWNGRGKFPGVDAITTGTPNQKQRAAILRHFLALAELLQHPARFADRYLFNGGLFSAQEYADVRFAVLTQAPCPVFYQERLLRTYLCATPQTCDNGSLRETLVENMTAIHAGLLVTDGTVLALPNVTRITGRLAIQGSGQFSARKLQLLDGSMDISERGTLVAPSLIRITGDAQIDGNACLDNLESIGGDLIVERSSYDPKSRAHGNLRLPLRLPTLAEVGRNVCLLDDTAIDAPRLRRINEGISMPDRSILRVPSLSDLPATAEWRIGQFSVVTGNKLTQQLLFD